MKKRLFFSSLFLLFLTFVAVQAYGADKDAAGKLSAPGENGRYQRMTNNFFIIYDPEQSYL